MKYILLISHVDSYFRILIDIAKIIKKFSDIEPLIYFPKVYPSVESDIKICQIENIKYYKGFKERWNNLETKATNSIKRTTVVPNKMKACVNVIRKSLIYMFIKAIKDIVKEYKKFKRLDNKFDCKLLLLGGDNIGYNIPVWVKAYKKKGVQSIIIPGWMAGPLEAFEAYKHNPDHQLYKISNKIIGSVFKRYVYEKDGIKILRWNGGKICALQILGLAPPKPWVLNSGFTDVILAESEAMRDYMVREGLQADKIIITGSITHDVLVKTTKKKYEIKKNICKSLDLDSDKPIILTALPPNQLYSFGRPDCEFNVYNDLIHAWMTQLTSLPTYNVIVSIHPSQSLYDMKFIENNKAKIYSGSVRDIIPICDIYVASISATIQWAIACGIPVVNYDVYRYRYNDYINESGVVSIEDYDDYKNVIEKIKTDFSYLQYLKNLQKKQSNYWGKLDGNANKRIKKLILQRI